jgi:hypothetical protein
MTQFNKLPWPVSQEQLVKMAGQETFDQAQKVIANEALYRAVTNIVIEEHRASANINGFETRVDYPGHSTEQQKPTGACSCPASEGFDFCEHCVVLCLIVNKQIQQIRSLAKGPDKSKILAYLLSLDKHELARQSLQLISEDPNTFERYLWKAFLHHGDIDYSQLKAHITQLTRKPENLFSQRQVKAFFQKIERFLAELAAEDAPDYDPEKLQKLIEYAFHRLNLLLEHVDDSNEQREQCLAYLRQLYFSALSRQHCRDDTLAKRLFQFWITDRFELLGATFVKSLPESVIQKFNKQLKAHWQTDQPDSTRQANPSTLKNWQILKLARYLFEEAIQSHDEEKAQYYRHFISKDVNNEQLP